MSDDLLKRGTETTIADLRGDDPLLWKTLQEVHRSRTNLTSLGGGNDLDAPLDLRVARPSAIDLTTFWAQTGTAIPPAIKAALGPKVPILLHHVITPFATDGKPPNAVWGLGYEFTLDGGDANTVSVLPTDEVLKMATVNQKVEVGLQIGGGVGVPKSVLPIMNNGPSLSLTGADIQASTDQTYSMSLHLDISLRKVVGAPIGIGGAQWKMYRQDERLDRPHTLVQTLLVAAGTKRLQCTIKTWAKQAGWWGTSFGAKFWAYSDQKYTISLI